MEAPHVNEDDGSESIINFEPIHIRGFSIDGAIFTSPTELVTLPNNSDVIEQYRNIFSDLNSLTETSVPRGSERDEVARVLADNHWLEQNLPRYKETILENLFNIAKNHVSLLQYDTPGRTRRFRASIDLLSNYLQSMSDQVDPSINPRLEDHQRTFLDLKVEVENIENALL